MVTILIKPWSSPPHPRIHHTSSQIIASHSYSYYYIIAIYTYIYIYRVNEGVTNPRQQCWLCCCGAPCALWRCVGVWAASRRLLWAMGGGGVRVSILYNYTSSTAYDTHSSTTQNRAHTAAGGGGGRQAQATPPSSTTDR